MKKIFWQWEENVLNIGMKENVFLAGWACERGKKWSSLTLNGDLGTSGCQFTCLSHGSVFVSCLESATVFPTPPTPYNSNKWLREQSGNNEQSWLSFFITYLCSGSSCVIKCCCIFRVAGKWHSVCEKCCISMLILTDFFLGTFMPNYWWSLGLEL